MEINAQAGVAETPEQFIIRRDAELDAWLKNRDLLASIKEQERETREQVAATLFPTPKRGTNRYALNNGYAVKLVYGLDYKLGDKDKPDPLDPSEKLPINKQVEDVEERIAAIGNVGPTLVKRLIHWKPELVDSEYRKLDPDSEDEMQAKAIIDEILTVKPKAPQMEFELPKAK